MHRQTDARMDDTGRLLYVAQWCSSLDVKLAICGHGSSFYWGRWPSLTGKLSWDVTTAYVNSALHPFVVTKSSTSFGWGKAGKVTSAGWQVTLCDPIWYVISHSGEVSLHTAISSLPLLLYLSPVGVWPNKYPKQTPSDQPKVLFLLWHSHKVKVRQFSLTIVT